ncbi:hypothetical protein EVAR_9191_1 [Eumeta japonica]|uniref:FLYWCH-type domain-containing protein n=1 Tax=Eumeta variegata TaxID=151549 RepID=A0A4C1WPM5_EUMVA|nr:hypothetical protein EVAR_9191_1 [Eumeta japonica]
MSGCEMLLPTEDVKTFMYVSLTHRRQCLLAEETGIQTPRLDPKETLDGSNFVTSQLLSFEGHTFNMKYKTKNGQKWVCSTHSTKGCKAFVSTNDDNEITDYCTDHLHLPHANPYQMLYKQ